MNKKSYCLLLLISGLLSACSSNENSKDVADVKGINSSVGDGKIDQGDVRALGQALTFHASFDEGPDADLALGDSRIYSGKTVAGQQKPVSFEPGLGNPPLAIAKGQGKFGDALDFTLENTHVVFYKAEKNVAYSTKGFSGTLSFWLKLDPQKIPQTYTDPIQLTDQWDSLANKVLDYGPELRIIDHHKSSILVAEIHAYVLPDFHRGGTIQK